MITLVLALGMKPSLPEMVFPEELPMKMPVVEKRPGSADPVPMPTVKPNPAMTIPNVASAAVYRISMESPKLRNR